MLTADLKERILNPALLERVTTPDIAIKAIKNGMTIGTAGGPQFGYPKAMFKALVDHAKQAHDFKIDLWTSGPVGEGIDGLLAKNGILRKRLGQQSDSSLRRHINERKVLFSDMRSGMFPQQQRSGAWGNIDVAIIEAVGITQEGYIIPSTTLHDASTVVHLADRVIVEINLNYPMALEGIHDVYLLKNPPHRKILPIQHPMDRIGRPYIPVSRQKIAAIVESTLPDPLIQRPAVDTTSEQIGKNLVEFLLTEVKKSRLPKTLLPLQVGIGKVADAALKALLDTDLENMTIFTAGIGDGVLDLIDNGKLSAVTTSGLYLSTEGQQRFFKDLERYKSTIIIRPVDITDSPELLLRLGIIAVNTAVEIDIYGHVNSSHVSGSHVIAGIGGSGEFAQNAYLSVFLTPSISRKGAISSIVPMVTHVDHSEHVVDTVITEQGVADLRGLEPVERANLMIDQCAHPDYRPLLKEYLHKAISETGGHEPHLLDDAFSFHLRYTRTGSMKS